MTSRLRIGVAALICLFLLEGCAPVLPAPSSRRLAQSELQGAGYISYPSPFLTPQFGGRLSYGLTDFAEVGAGTNLIAAPAFLMMTPSIDAHVVLFDWVKAGATSSYSLEYSDGDFSDPAHYFIVQPRLTSVSTRSFPVYAGIQARKYLPWERDTYVGGVLGAEVDTTLMGRLQIEVGINAYHHTNDPDHVEGDIFTPDLPNLYYLSIGSHHIL